MTDNSSAGGAPPSYEGGKNVTTSNKSGGPEGQETRIRCAKCGLRINQDQKQCPFCKTIIFSDLEGVETRIENLEKMSLTQLAIREPEYLFELIHRGDDLYRKVRYYLSFSFLFFAGYGFGLGWYAGGWQLVSSTIKMPLLFMISGAICLPALFTFNVMLGTKLGFRQVAALTSLTAYISSIVLGSLAPIILFFNICSDSHDFITLLNVLLCGISGMLGLKILWAGLKYIAARRGEVMNTNLLLVWIVTYIFVGTQLAWILRPFVGSPEKFALFRDIESNFYIAVWKIIVRILS